MEFRDIIERRRSIRAYTSEPIDRNAIDRILHAVVRAPSAGNLQAVRVYLVRDRARRRRLAEAAQNQEFVASAPVDLVFFADPARSRAKYGIRGEHLYCVQDATIAATYANLAATNEGLASGWVGAFDDEKVRQACSEPDLLPVAIVPVGHGAEEPPPTSRRPPAEIVRELD